MIGLASFLRHKLKLLSKCCIFKVRQYISAYILNSKRNAYFAYLVLCINSGLNTDLMIPRVSHMYGTCVLSKASQMDGSLE